MLPQLTDAVLPRSWLMYLAAAGKRAIAVILKPFFSAEATAGQRLEIS